MKELNRGSALASWQTLVY